MKLNTVQVLALVALCALSLLGRATGDIRAAHVAITDELQRCASPFGSLQRSLGELLKCIKENLYRCVLYRDLQEHDEEFRLEYCGVINSGLTYAGPSSRIGETWVLIVPPEFFVKLQFDQFYFPFVFNCHRSTSFTIYKHPYRWHHVPQVVYCGHRMPWSVTVKSDGVFIICTECNSLTGYYFVMSYEALDYVPKINEEPLPPWIQKVFDYESEIPMPPIDDFSEDQRTQMFIDKQYLLNAMHDRFLTVYYTSGIHVKLVSFDGPGPLSPRLYSEVSGKYRVIRSSSFLLFIAVYKLMEDDNKEHMSDRAAQDFSFKIHYNQSVREHWPDDCIRLASGVIRFTRTSGHCLAERNIDYLTIHQFRYTGFNTLLHHGMLDPFCQYGGLYLTIYPREGQTIATRHLEPFCANITSEATVPVIDKTISWNSLTDGELIKDVRLILITFEGYSSGFVDVSLHSEEDCVGMNRAAYDTYFEWYNPVEEYIWPDVPRDSLEKPSLKECTDDWLTYNLDNDVANLRWIHLSHSQSFLENRSDFIQWKYRNHNYRGSKLIVTSSLFSRTGRQSWKEFDMSLEMTKASEVPGRHHVATYRANLLQERRIELDDVAGVLSMTLNYSGHDRLPVLAMRLQLIHHHVCASLVFDGTSDVPQSFLFAGAQQDISVSRDFIYNDVMLGIWGYTGQSLGACRMLLTGIACSDGVTEYHIARVSLDATGFDLAVEVDISLKQLDSCSRHCALDISIREAGPQDQHITQWSGVRRLKWRLKNLYFSTIDLRSVCLDCHQKLCDVALAIRVLKPWIPLLADDEYMSEEIAKLIREYQARFFPEELLRKYLESEHAGRYVVDAKQSELTEDAVYGNGSWQDAQSQCVALHSHLPTWTPTLASQLTYLLQRYDYTITPDRLVFTNDSYSPRTKRIFAGLHRQNPVSISSISRVK
jgi:hypothetical protein